MADTINTLTPGQIAADPYGALRVAALHNPGELSSTLISQGIDAPSDPEALYQFLVGWFNTKGNFDDIIGAIQASASPSSNSKTFNWMGAIGGILTGVGTAISGGSNQSAAEQQAMILAQQQAAQQRTTNTILIILGVVVIGVIVFFVVKRAKK